MKECFECKTKKLLSEFYAHPQMKDGHLNKCKECCKRQSVKHRWDNIERIRKYDRERGCRKTNEKTNNYRKKNSNVYKAQTRFNNAIRYDKTLIKSECCVCGSKKRLVAHHDDYLKPLEVRWMCQCCHLQWHRDNGPGKNKN